MRITKWIDIQQEVEIDISWEDINNHLRSMMARQAPHRILGALNDIACFFRSIPSEIISDITDSQRRVIKGFLLEQAERFSVDPDVKV